MTFSHPCRRPSPATLVVAATAFLLGGEVVGCGSGGSTSHIAVGRSVAPLDLVSLAEPPRDEASPTPPDASAEPAVALEGKVTLLNFWGTWCPPCRRELPGMARLATRLADEPRFQLVAVSCGTGRRDELDTIRDETRSFLRERGLAIEAWADPDGLTRFQFASTMGFSAYPTTYLVGPDAIVRRVWTGYRSRDEADMAAAVVALLREGG